MPDYKQETRHLILETPLGPDVLLLTEMSGEEQLSRLFSYELRMLSPDDGLKAEDIVGQRVTFSVGFPDGSSRYFNGHVNRFAYLGTGDRLSVYRAQVVPWLWFLTRTAQCRIFQEKSVPDVIKEVFDKLGFNGRYDDSQLKGAHPPWEYCVQYRETDFNFVSRLMEQEGIFYFFRHEQGKHTLVLADQAGAYEDCVDKQVDFSANLSGPNPFDEITSWEHQYEFQSGKWSQTDYNFETPSTNLMTQTGTTIPLEGVAKYEVYDYPGEYEKKSDGQSDTQLRIEAEEAGYDVVHGASYCRSFTPGGKFKLKRHPSSSEAGKSYVLVSVRHWAGAGGTYLTGGDPSNEGYGNSFTCIPSSATFRPARTTPKPCIQGSQTAIVTGPSGEEIWPDKYSRVKVQFHWDRDGKKDDKSSCWIRVAQPWAGKQWGAIHIPRVGQEVVVSYLEGDPDRPLITGMVYNAETMPPYPLPDNKTQTGIKTRSTKQGGAANFNELRFEDKKDSEEVYFHAEKDFNRVVENNDTLKVGSAQADDGSQTITVWKDRTETVKTGNEQVTIEQGNQTTKLNMGAASTEAMQSITLKVGQNSITIDQTGVTIKGMMISIEGQIQTEVKGLMTQINGSAMLQTQGGITMIN